MSRPELRPFADEHLDAAAELFAERHRRHRTAEATLPARFEDPAAAREEVEKAWRLEGVREARPDDLEGVFELTPLIREHQSSAPVFSANRRVETPEQTRAAIVEEITNEEVGTLVAEAGDRLVGGFIVAAAEQSGEGPHAFSGLARPERAAYLAWAVTRPDVRGSGAGVALTEACFAWARRRGYETMVTDWRVTNLLASRFWPRRGFRTTFLRLYRHVP